MSNKPRVLSSACLEHCKCRYDGSVIENSVVKRLSEFVTFDIVCPEMGIGLPSPREAIRVIKDDTGEKLVDSYTGTDRTEDMNHFIDSFLKTHHEGDYDAVLLKCKSPTCGLKDVKLYAGPGKRPSLPERTQGFFGRVISEKFKKVVVEDEGRLKHFNIREHFYMSLFLRHRFRMVKLEATNHASLHPLVRFHSVNKYLFMAYNQSALKKMGSIVANHNRAPLSEVLSNYEDVLSVIYSQSLTPGKNVNMLLHLFGYFKNDLTATEKSFYLDQLALYQAKKIPFSAVLAILQSWVIRFDEPYLKDQTIFNMFPNALIEVTDSGKGL